MGVKAELCDWIEDIEVSSEGPFFLAVHGLCSTTNKQGDPFLSRPIGVRTYGQLKPRPHRSPKGPSITWEFEPVLCSLAGWTQKATAAILISAFT